MKQLIHSLQDREILFIEIPEDSYDFEINEEARNTIYYYNPKESFEYNEISLPPGKWKLICEYPGATEEQAAKVVDNFDTSFLSLKGIAYRNYKQRLTPVFDLDTALESLQSLIKSLGIETVNPLGGRPRLFTSDDFEHCKYEYPHGFDIEQYNKDLLAWEAAQSKVWEKVLILTNNK